MASESKKARRRARDRARRKETRSDRGGTKRIFSESKRRRRGLKIREDDY